MQKDGLSLDDLKVKPGELMPVAMARLEAFMRSFKLVKHDPRILLTVMPGIGTQVKANVTPPSYVGAFACSQVGATSAQVGFGLVNDKAPFIDDVGLDGIDKDGEETDVPTLELTGGPGEENRSWIAIQALIDPETGGLLKGNEGLKIVHVRELHESHYDGGPLDEKGSGIEPIAMVIWSGDKVLRIRQIALNHKGYRFVAGKDGKRGRHFFWGK